MKKASNFLTLICIFSLCLVFVGCPDKADNSEHIWLTNKSDKTVFVFYKIEQFGGECPDTIFPSQRIGSVLQEKYNSSDLAPLTCDTFRVFFIDADALELYGWNRIREDYNVLKRYDLTMEDIKRIDYDVCYPPTEAMKNIKMYPPYQ